MSTIVTMACFALAAGPQIDPAPPFAFHERGAGLGIGPYTMAPGMGGGVAAADFDDDGDIDLFVPNAPGVPDQLYRNLGDGRFEEIAAAAGVAGVDQSRVALWFDHDVDGDLNIGVNDMIIVIEMWGQACSE